LQRPLDKRNRPIGAHFPKLADIAAAGWVARLAAGFRPRVRDDFKSERSGEPDSRVVAVQVAGMIAEDMRSTSSVCGWSRPAQAWGLDADAT
jgi:hypothetical protein